MAEADEFPARALLDALCKIADAMSEGASLHVTLDRVARLVESLAPPALCSIVRMHHDGKRLKSVVAPSLPEAFGTAIDGIEIGPCCGSCGTAAWRKQPVIVTDIATDPLWAGGREFALSFGLRACWSMPILANDGEVFGVIAMYYREPRAPTQAEQSLLERCAKLIRLAMAIEREQHEARTNETRWQLAADAGGLGTFVFDFASGNEQWSPRLRYIIGVGDAVPASIETFINMISPADRQAFLDSIPDPRNGSTKIEQDIQVRMHRADTGEERVVVAKGRLLRATDGRPTRVVGTVADVTEQLARENDLAQAKAAAEAANRAKSRFLANMSHELRTPLNAIIGFSEMMFQGILGKIEPPQYGEYSQLIHQSGKHLLSLINDVLDMAKIEAEKFELHCRPLDIANLVESSRVFVASEAERARVAIVVDVPRGVMLNVDERAMCQVFTNLLSNAVKFTQAGGSIRVFGEKLADGGLAIGVEDNGIGMSEDGLATALQPFGQIESGTLSARMAPLPTRIGTGLGLPLAKAMIEHHGATFHITSSLGEGTRVWGEFPASDVSEWEDAAAASI